MQAVGGVCLGKYHSSDNYMITAIWKHMHGFPMGSLDEEVGLARCFLLKVFDGYGIPGMAWYPCTV